MRRRLSPAPPRSNSCQPGFTGLVAHVALAAGTATAQSLMARAGNRQRLLRALAAQGFANYPLAW
ncbi:hypothetical protein [Xanthomonas translucens]|uniref:hypothetical protein n=1 Tax=Xanthomonas campestris pv. translucens TaxID=343 RepID=UPI0002A78C03|nr:hypothetical protein [Xanthomonas translucens]AKK66376.1 hypothetical protein FD63_02190 [Xanthomonas translucens pv. undulosa]AVY65221.1 hypothetical protein NZ30_02220 [Xanthomonas translucens pv. undulosa]ELQ17218.1 hypothetical protein A989_00435 [Xanthomonas translucens DAR61454]MBC3970963.1 hypothetical protein [Xanthomonas translucens pv. undulosa]MCT8270195.1 hypothetical protein [Xanthomonas translucens pv. undulosa]